MSSEQSTEALDGILTELGATPGVVHGVGHVESTSNGVTVRVYDERILVCCLCGENAKVEIRTANEGGAVCDECVRRLTKAAAEKARALKGEL